MKVEQASPRQEVLYIGFNQDHACFAVGTTSGFRIFNCDPFKETLHRDFGEDGGVGIVEMLFRCNILALVGGGRRPQWAPTKVVLWDDNQSKQVFELPFNSEVLSVKMRRDKLVVALEEKVQVFSLTGSVADTLSPLRTFKTFCNPRGLIALSWHSTSSVLAIPSLTVGDVLVHVFNESSGAKPKEQAIVAHDSPLSAVVLSHDGTRLATASEKGTLVRIFATAKGECLQELRRGLSQAGIYSLVFSIGAHWLCVSSNTGTAHVFSLANPAPDPVKDTNVTHRVIGGRERVSVGPSNPKSWLGSVSGVLPGYFSSEWSFARYRGVSVPSICTFGPSSGPSEVNTLIVVGADCTLTNAYFLNRVVNVNEPLQQHFFSLTLLHEQHRYLNHLPVTRSTVGSRL